MEVAITKQAIMDALQTTDIEFDMAILNVILDKLPSATYARVIEDEYFENLCLNDFLEAEDIRDGSKFRFNKMSDLTKFAKENGITQHREIISRYATSEAVIKGSWIFRRLPGNQGKRSDIICCNGNGIFDSRINGSKAVKNSSGKRKH